MEAKSSSRKFSYVRDCATTAGDCINTLEGFVRNLCCTFSKLSKQLGFGEKYFYCSSRGYCSMHARWSSFKTILGPRTFSKLVQFAIFGCKCLTAWASAGFFSGRVHQWIVTKFLQGRTKSGEIYFFLFETKKTPFLLKFLKSRGAEVLLSPPFRRPCVMVIQMLESYQIVTSFPQHIFV